MRAVRYHEPGPPEVLRVDDVPQPEVGADELLVAVEAASINPVDAKYRSGGHDRMPKTTGSDFAGAVREVGSDVGEYDVGDRVFGTGLYHTDFTQGSFAEFVAVPTSIVAPLPSSVSSETGAAVPIVGTTAWLALMEWADLGPTDTCLVHGGAGGVGHVGVQLAAAAGSSVVATVGSTERLAAAERFGADLALDYTTEDVRGSILEAHPDGVDAILEPRFDENARLDVHVAGFGADVVVIDGDGTPVDGPKARGKQVTVRMLSMTPLIGRDDQPDLSSVLREIAKVLDDGTLSVEVSRRYDLADAVAAHRDVMEESIVGKAVVTI